MAVFPPRRGAFLEVKAIVKLRSVPDFRTWAPKDIWKLLVSKGEPAPLLQALDVSTLARQRKEEKEGEKILPVWHEVATFLITLSQLYSWLNINIKSS